MIFDNYNSKAIRILVSVHVIVKILLLLIKIGDLGFFDQQHHGHNRQREQVRVPLHRVLLKLEKLTSHLSSRFSGLVPQFEALMGADRSMLIVYILFN